ncbi:uncharacterized protein LOC119206920 [Pungitius pungitius]|uniref:uncharacterized protein LOC119206920 n=1 Tax=Pungitius pungitius TaxID=134920 RepID=UPI002E12D2DA
MLWKSFISARSCDLKATPCEPLKTHFPHPRTRDKVFVMMDACHMLKLTRNILEVSLAAQALSNSVAVALRTLQDLKEYAVFQDCEATAEFIEITDRLFDILNSRNPRARGLLSVLGFVINIDTLMAMIPVLLEGQRYVLTYRFSQDHLELLFNSIRASGFVVRRTLKKLSCDVCRASLLMDAESASKDQSYHLLTLKNNGGLVIPSAGTVKVVRAAEWVFRQAVADSRRSQPIKLLEVLYMVRKRIGGEDVFLLGEHITDTRYGIDSHHHTLLTLVVSLFFKLRLHHIAKMSTLSLQKDSVRQKLTKTVLLKGQ